MRKINYLVVHCTGAAATQSVDSIKDYWRRILGWKSPGYHIIIPPDGSIVRLAPDSAVTNGVAGINSQCLHVCYIGGVDKNKKATDTRTAAQKETILDVLKMWKKQFPKAIIQGHRDFPGVKKDCPSFNAKLEYKDLT